MNADRAKIVRRAVLVLVWIFLLWLGGYSAQHEPTSIVMAAYILVAATGAVTFLDWLWNRPKTD